MDLEKPYEVGLITSLRKHNHFPLALQCVYECSHERNENGDERLPGFGGPSEDLKVC